MLMYVFSMNTVKMMTVMMNESFILFCLVCFVFLLYYREKPKVVKPTANSDGPDAKRAKIDPNETIVMKKVDGRSHFKLYEKTRLY